MNIVKWYNKEFELIFEYNAKYHARRFHKAHHTSVEWFNRIELGKGYLVYVVVNNILIYKHTEALSTHSSFNNLMHIETSSIDYIYYNDSNRFDMVRMSKLKKILS